MTMKKAKPGAKHWVWRFLSGTYGYNGLAFLSVIAANNEAKTIYKKIVAALRSKGIEI
jgi:hypothetical protein